MHHLALTAAILLVASGVAALDRAARHPLVVALAVAALLAVAQRLGRAINTAALAAGYARAV